MPTAAHPHPHHPHHSASPLTTPTAHGRTRGRGLVPVLSTLAAIVASTALTGGAAAQSTLPFTIIREADAFGDSSVQFITQVVCNRSTGYLIGINTFSGLSNFYGNTVRGTPSVLRTEGTIGVHTQTTFESFFGFGNGGQIAYSPTVGLGDAVFVDDAPIAVETEAVTAIPGQFWRFASRPTATGTGEAWWVSGLSSTSGGSTQNRGLFRGTGTPVLVGGGTVVGAAEALNTGTAISFDFGVSALGTHYIVEANLASTAATDTAVVMDGAIVTLGGGLAREGQVIPVSVGGDGVVTWQNFDFMGVNEAGRYFFTGDSNAAATADEFIVRDGKIVFRDGMLVDGQTLQGDIEMATMNNDGDLGFIWDIGAGAVEALYLNRRLVIKEGDAIDLDNNGQGDSGAALFDFTNIACMGVTGRDGARVDVYFTADIDTDGNTATSADRVEAAFRMTVCLADINRAGGVTVQDIFDFLSLWFAGDLGADYNNDGAVTVQDIFDFLAGWFAGCPA